ncbi:hypothetical protein Tco_0686902 [Tanacetum coccineum]
MLVNSESSVLAFVLSCLLSLSSSQQNHPCPPCILSSCKNTIDEIVLLELLKLLQRQLFRFQGTNKPNEVWSLDCVLQDQQGNRVQATAKNQQINKFHFYWRKEHVIALITLVSVKIMDIEKAMEMNMIQVSHLDMMLDDIEGNRVQATAKNQQINKFHFYWRKDHVTALITLVSVKTKGNRVQATAKNQQTISWMKDAVTHIDDDSNHGSRVSLRSTYEHERVNVSKDSQTNRCRRTNQWKFMKDDIEHRQRQLLNNPGILEEIHSDFGLQVWRENRTQRLHGTPTPTIAQEFLPQKWTDGGSLNLPDQGTIFTVKRCLRHRRIHKDGDGDASFQLKSGSFHSYAQSTKTFYKHQDSRIMKAQELKTKTSAQTLILKITPQKVKGAFLGGDC